MDLYASQNKDGDLHLTFYDDIYYVCDGSYFDSMDKITTINTLLSFLKLIIEDEIEMYEKEIGRLDNYISELKDDLEQSRYDRMERD